MTDGYLLTYYSWGALALLMLVQILIADVIGIRSKQVPGTPVQADHNSVLFRASRTVANTNESIAVYILIMLLCVLSGADATYTGYLSWAFVASRLAYAFCYYFNIQTLRSVCFGISLLVLFSLLGVGIFT